eukprot:CAMPEP_0170450938 /NCGR_PEP_ID=MMETSP0123-20130129/319_1 /TAXON_ID=182087 /ORGANISM="Favella ehrenbergii, Strain Fehren 1" /LENGTH=106 /DNA_ID=CAMNT_0010712409 /DNA_START=26 /DNA_END=346 /DNA_ORIENTATION=+
MTMFSSEGCVDLVADDATTEDCHRREKPDEDEVDPEDLARLKQVVFGNERVVSLLFAEVITGADLAGLVQSIKVRHDEDVRAVKQKQLVDPANEMTVHEQAADAVD